MRGLTGLALVAALAVAAPARAASDSLVISQVYGGGDSAGATVADDYVELFNRGRQAIDTAGMSVQYAAATGNTWSVAVLGDHAVDPGEYLLVRMSPGTTGGAALPAPDAFASTPMSATAGKVALTTQTVPLPCGLACPGAAGVIDFVGYGAAADAAEGAPAADPDATTAAGRAAAGCTDTDANSADFAVAAPQPRNSGTTAAPCASGPVFDQYMLLSRAGPDGPGGNGQSGDVPTWSGLTPGGGLAAFTTQAANLRPPGFVPATDTSDVLLRDLDAATSELVSLPDGPPPNPVTGPLGDGAALRPAVSADGNRIAFLSDAPDLAPPTLYPRVNQAWVRDRQAQTTRLASRNSAGDVANAAAQQPDLSADGRFVAFTSTATNLGEPIADSGPDVFVHDLASGDTTLISYETDNLGSNQPVLSADGRYVAFTTFDDPFGDSPGPSRVLVADRDFFGELALVSVDDDQAPADDDALAPTISADGRFISFLSRATNLGGSADGFLNAFVRDIEAGETHPVTPGPERAVEAVISPDGSHVVYNTGGEVWARDIHDGSVELLADDVVNVLGVSDGAGTVTFSSQARDLAPGTDPANDLDVFARTLVSGVPVADESPEVTGTPQEGQTLTCRPGRWSERPLTYAYEWLRDGTAVASGPTYPVVTADESHQLACRVVATNAAGASQPATSVAVTVTPKLPILVTAPGLDGTPQVGSTLTCVPGSFSGDVDSLTYRWLRSSGGGPFFAIDGAIGTTYVVQLADVGSRVSCEETATNDFGSTSGQSESRTAATGVPMSTSPPTVSGLPAVGELLTCQPGTWDNQPLRFTYRWLRDGQPVPLQTDATRVASSQDRETRTACEVTAGNDVGSGAPATSEARFIVGERPENVTAPALALDDVGPRPTDYRATCSPGTWRDTEPSGLSYAIAYAGGETVATTPTYDIRAADLGRALFCTVTSTNVRGARSATSNTVTVPLPPVDPTAGLASMYKTGGYNEFDPVNFLAVAPGTREQLEAQSLQRVRSGYDAFVAQCPAAPGAPDPAKNVRLMTNQAEREAELCRVLRATPADQVVFAADGVRIVADPSQCVLGSDDPCGRLPVPLPAAPSLAPTGVGPGVEPVRVLWDFDSDARLDASCAGAAPVARTIFDRGSYNVRAILVLPDSEATGLYPSVTLTYRHFPKGAPSPSLVQEYSPSASQQVSFLGGRRQGLVTAPVNVPITVSLALGQLRKAQPFACKDQLQPPPEPAQACVSEGYAGKVRVRGNLCPISLRATPQDELDALKASDEELWALLKEQNSALGVRRRSGAVTRPTQLRATPLAAAQTSLSQFAVAMPSRLKVTSAVSKVLKGTERAAQALDQIYISRGPVDVNGVDLVPAAGRAVVFVPSDAGGGLEPVKRMIVSASRSIVSLGQLPLSPGAEKFKADLADAAGGAASQFATQNLDQLGKSLREKLDLGPFRLAGDAKVSLVDGAAVLEAQAELPALTTAPGAAPVRVGVKIRADQDGRVQLAGVRLRAGLAYLGAVKVKDLDLLYDGGLTVSGQLLFPPVDGGIEIERFRIGPNGSFQELILNYLAGAGQGIPVGPGIFLTKVGGGLSLDPDEVRANAAVSVGPSAGGGCPVVGGDGTILVHFAPAPFTLSAKIDMGLVCLKLAGVEFLARSDGYVTLAGNLGFEGGPLYFNAGCAGLCCCRHGRWRGPARAASATSSAGTSRPSCPPAASRVAAPSTSR